MTTPYASAKSEAQIAILRQVEAAGGRVHQDTFKGQGFAVSGLVRRGLLEWERGAMPKTTRATALLLTEAGRYAISDASHADAGVTDESR